MSGIRGQGRKFDLDEATDAAMHTFWNHGYEGTSIAMLTSAMGIKAPSLYAAFGSKEELFFCVVEHYNSTRGGYMKRAFDEERHSPTLVRRLLLESAVHYAATDSPGGCLVISSAICVGSDNAHVADRLRALRNANIETLRARLDADRRNGIVPAQTDPDATASFAAAVLQGMSQRGRDGASRDELEVTAEMACRAMGFP